MHAAFFMSLIWAWLARVIAGKAARQENGYAVIYMENGKRSACAFRPDADFLAALERTLPQAFGRDEREMLDTYAAKSLRRTFGDLYPHVPEPVTAEELAFEREEFARRKAARAQKRRGERKRKK